MRPDSERDAFQVLLPSASPSGRYLSRPSSAMSSRAMVVGCRPTRRPSTAHDTSRSTFNHRERLLGLNPDRPAAATAAAAVSTEVRASSCSRRSAPMFQRKPGGEPVLSTVSVHYLLTEVHIMLANHPVAQLRTSREMAWTAS